MIDKDKLQEYALKLMFKLEENELNTLQEEFDIILKQMDLIDGFDGIEEVEPMVFPFVNYEATLREDEDERCLDIEEILQNTTYKKDNQVVVPKVVK